MKSFRASPAPRIAVRRAMALFAFLFVLPTKMIAQDTGRISGRVLDEDFARPLAMAQVSIPGTNLGTVSDVDGRFSLSDVPAGTHAIQIRLIGFAQKTVTDVVVTAGQVTVLDVSLPREAVEVQELTVSVASEQGTTAALLENRRTAAAVTDAIGREQISQSPDSDAAAAMVRVPGVSVVDDRYVYVRGLGERYGATTLDGAVLPSPIPDRKAIPLDLVPASFIESVSTSKSYVPSNPADYAGGLVEIKTRKVPGQNFFTIAGKAGYDTQSSFKTGLDYSGGARDFLGFDDGFRDIPGLIPRDVAVNPSNFSPQELELIGEAFSPAWEGISKDLPMNGGFDLAMATDIPVGEKSLGIFATVDYSDTWGRREDYVERVFAASGILDPEVDYTGQATTREVSLGGMLNADIALSPTTTITFSGLLNRLTEDESRILQGFNLDSNTDQLSTRIRYTENNLFQGRVDGRHLLPAFGGTTMEWRGTYAKTKRYEPNTREVLYRETTDGTFLFDTFIQSGSIFHQELGEDAWNGSLDFQVPVRVAGTPGTIEFGGAAVRRDRDVYTRRFRFLPQGVLGDEVRSRSPDELFTPATISPDSFQIQEATFRPDNYTGDLTTLAGYVMADIEPIERIRVAAGFRVERTEQNVDPQDLFSTSLEPLEGARLNNTDFIPGGTVTWATNDAMNVRVAASRTIARPEFRELAPFSFADFAGGYLRVGNPGLVRSRITNLDVRWEWFPSQGAVFAISGFYKNFTDPIEEVVFPSSEFITSWTNAVSAENIGAEVEARSNLAFLTESLENVSINLNLTLVDSEVDTGTEAQVWVPGVGAVPIGIVPRKRRLQGQSPYVVNAGVNWFVPTTNTALTVLYNRFGDRIASVGTQFLPDVLEQPRDQLDIVIEQGITDRIEVKASAKDLFASNVRFTQGGDVLRGWSPGRVFELKLSWQPTGAPNRP
jgi:hypothetical protein